MVETFSAVVNFVQIFSINAIDIIVILFSVKQVLNSVIILKHYDIVNTN